MNKVFKAGVVGAVLAGLSVAGCSGGQSDLQKWIADTKKKPGGRIQALPEVKPYETYVYSAAKLRSPFQPQGPGTANGQASLRPTRAATGNFSKAFRSIPCEWSAPSRWAAVFTGWSNPRTAWSQGSARQLSRAERRQSDGNYRRKN